MNLLTLVALLTLSLTDPSGDAIGSGSLEPPTSPIYANAAQFDLLAVELESPELHSAELPGPGGGAGSRLTITMGSLSTRGGGLQEEVDETADTSEEAPAVDETQLETDGGRQDAGFDVSSLLAIIDVYIGSGDGGLDRTLAGPNMLMPLGHGWRHAVRVSADGAMAITYSQPPEPDGEGAQQPSRTPVTDEVAEDAPGIGAQEGGSAADQLLNTDLQASAPDAATDGQLTVEWLTVTRSGNDLVVELPWEFEGEVELYALSGVHDPFSTSGWRQLSPQPSPWAFSGDSQLSPVIDMVAEDAVAQSAALASGVLPLPPRTEPGFTLPRTPWIYLMIGGLLLAVAGLVMRGLVSSAGKVVVSDADALTPAPAESEVAAEAAPPSTDEVVLADESPHIDEIVVLADDDTPPDNDGGQDETVVVMANDDSSEIVLVRDEPVPSEQPAQPNEASSVDEPQPCDQPAQPREVSSVEELDSEVEPFAAAEPPEATVPGRARERALVGSGVERSYLGADNGGFEDDDVYQDELDESFWHPRSRKPTLTDATSSETSSSAVSSSELGKSGRGKSGFGNSGLTSSGLSNSRVTGNKIKAGDDEDATDSG